MPTLPAHPDLDQLRRQAKELLRAARAGDPGAAARVDPQTLAGAQLAVARSHGFSSWPALKTAVEELAAQAEEFIAASLSNRPGRAFRMLTPELAGFNIATAVVLGDEARVLAELQRDPDRARRPDRRTGWTALHLVCASRWHRDPTRAGGLAAIASGAPEELVELLREHGAEAHASETELFLLACLRGDREEAMARRGRLAEADQGAIFSAAAAGKIPALELMLALGFSVEARGDHSGTPLHGAA